MMQQQKESLNPFKSANSLKNIKDSCEVSKVIRGVCGLDVCLEAWLVTLSSPLLRRHHVAKLWPN